MWPSVVFLLILSVFHSPGVHISSVSNHGRHPCVLRGSCICFWMSPWTRASVTGSRYVWDVSKYIWVVVVVVVVESDTPPAGPPRERSQALW